MRSQFFEWDDAKAQSNLAKHGITFEKATAVFRDPMALTFDDEDHSLDENREITIGCTSFTEVLVVNHVLRDGRIRIISARRASRAERTFFMNQPPDRIHDKPRYDDDLRPEYDFDRNKGVKGKYYTDDDITIMVSLDSDVARHFSTPQAVNDALRALIAEGRAPAPRTE
jgi:uncharacterized DUF497 family protein